MFNFAVINDDKIVENIIVANNLEIAQEVTKKTCIDVTDKYVMIGFEYKNGKFHDPNPLINPSEKPLK